MSQNTESQFGWLKDISTKDLINRKFFATTCNDLVMVQVISAEIDRRIEEKNALRNAVVEAHMKASFIHPFF